MVRHGQDLRATSRSAPRRWLAGLVLGVLVAVSCSPTPSPSTQATGPTAESTAVATPQASDEEPRPSVSPDAVAELPAILLQEVMFDPPAGTAAFVELANVSDASVPLAPLTLIVGGSVLPLERAGTDLASGACLVIELDGGARADRSTYHAAPYVTLDPTAGSVSILDGFGDPIDQVAWGTAPGAVATSPGGVTRELEPGSSIGRAPGATGARDRLAWVPYPPDQVTPGGPNPPAAVGGLHPMSGAVLPVKEAKLSWFPVPGVASYRVQVAADETFASPALDTEGAGTSLDVSGLAPGRYVWHVQSVNAEGSAAAYSEPSLVELAAEATGIVFAVSISPRRLPVPLISQHKDTKMLLLESQFADGEHAWDVDHDQLDKTDPADNMNCALASLAMMNHFAGGDLTQDRIGFEVRKSEAPGPEYDVNYGAGFSDDDIEKTLYPFALGVTPTPMFPGSVDRLWGHVMSAIDRGIPVLAANPHHVFVITGYVIKDDHRWLAINDPWDGRYAVDIDRFAASRGNDPAITWKYWLADRIRPVHGETTIAKDSDGDGVVDFDETERFNTDPNVPDTDLDGVHDKQDIYASVFDTEHGYAFFRTGRDHDHDSLPMERDPDSDQGGCDDGLEDANGNGLYEFWANESWNFDLKDDTCKGLAGQITFTYEQSGTVFPTEVTANGSLTVVVRLKPDPNDPGGYLDDGSTFSFRETDVTRVPIDGCTQIAHQSVSASGTFTGDLGSLEAHVHDDVLLLSAEQSVPSYSYADLCFTSAEGTGEHAAVFPSECEGKAQAGPGPGRTYVFDCPRSPFPPGDLIYTTWNVHGSLTAP